MSCPEKSSTSSIRISIQVQRSLILILLATVVAGEAGVHAARQRVTVTRDGEVEEIDDSRQIATLKIRHGKPNFQGKAGWLDEAYDFAFQSQAWRNQRLWLWRPGIGASLRFGSDWTGFDWLCRL
jgi:hypothetical protein